MATIVTGLALLAFAILLGCAGSPATSGLRSTTPVILTPASAIPTRAPATPSSTPSTTASPSASAQRTFESDRHGYRVVLPGAWGVTEYEGVWTALFDFGVGDEVPGEDVIAPLTLLSFLVVNSMAIPDGTTDSQWRSEFNDLVQEGLPAGCPGVISTGTVAGVDTTVVTQECEGDVIVGHSLTYKGRGYYFTTRSAVDDSASMALLEQLVESVEFVE